MKQAKMALTNSRERYRVLRGAGTLVKHLFRKHGAPQEASGYAEKAKTRGSSSHSHSLEETLAEAVLQTKAAAGDTETSDFAKADAVPATSYAEPKARQAAKPAPVKAG
jgi:hypothetical protein